MNHSNPLYAAIVERMKTVRRELMEEMNRRPAMPANVMTHAEVELRAIFRELTRLKSYAERSLKIKDAA